MQWYDDDEDTDGSDGEATTTPRIQIMFLIFLVSLFGRSPSFVPDEIPLTIGCSCPRTAASFPTLSRRIPALRVPSILFFIGKHFGTGVILSTAFVHLLQDAFESLQSPVVRARWPRIGDSTGLIVYVLSSFVLCFCAHESVSACGT